MTSPERSFVRYARTGDVIWLTLDRPDRLNAIHMAMRDDLWRMLCLLRDDHTARVAVVQGAGDRAFSAGADVLEFGSAPSLLAAREARQGRDLWGLMAALPIPLIAALHGFAYGAGLELALYCDLRVAAADARFALPEVALGYIPSAGGTQTLHRHIARSEALRMVLAGEPIGAAEAYATGLVHAVVPRAELEATARAWAERLAACSPAALRATKRAVVEGLELPLAEGLALEQRLAAAVAAERAVGRAS
ncbi:MAG: enoyl-CoA hydratase/isomerase family protein [Dehalococcoidia bacterium]|nr:enoyl-CoA hydratase/isomerase family protein [Dehalococcoidia bacterium]